MGYAETMTEYPYEIYLITSEDHWYVGRAVGPTRTAAKRFKEHANGNGGAKKLWQAIQDRGVEAFTQIILENETGDYVEAEQRWYDFYKFNDPRESLNLKRPDCWDGIMTGRKASVETRAKLSAGLMGKQRALGSKHSPEACAAKSVFQKTRIHSPEQHAKIAVANTGKKRSLESRERMRQAKLGRPMPLNTIKVACGECDLVTNRGALGRHIKATGHSYA